MNFNRGTSRSLFLLMLWTLGALAQSSSPPPQTAEPISPDEVVVVIDDVEFTARELRVPPQRFHHTGGYAHEQTGCAWQ